MSKPDSMAANRLPGSSMVRSSQVVSCRTLVRSSERRSATAAVVLRSTRAATGRLRMIRIQEAFRRSPVDHMGELPSQIHSILHAGVKTLSTVRGMHVCGVAGQQDPSVALGRGLPSHIGEP